MTRSTTVGLWLLVSFFISTPTVTAALPPNVTLSGLVDFIHFQGSQYLSNITAPTLAAILDKFNATDLGDLTASTFNVTVLDGYKDDILNSTIIHMIKDVGLLSYTRHSCHLDVEILDKSNELYGQTIEYDQRRLNDRNPDNNQVKQHRNGQSNDINSYYCRS
ncbi:hypothetical protein M3Y96_00254100 [Aphelenchoides besseyi]|nr:hypothetical protein M3Y96_00254100 [Aphelenchoides besseyi]